MPLEAAEVVQICGRLPLAVDLAGKMLRDVGVGTSDQGWGGIPDLLREEMRSSGDGDETTVEYRVIAASLAAIPMCDRAHAKKVFSVFALVAEDTHVPIEVFRILLSAVTGESELVPELQLRKWIQILIKRSIVLGTWERPSLHDIVRDYSIALFSPDELQELQRKVVDAFAAARPADPIPTFPSLRRWPISPKSGDVSGAYVKQQIEYHLRCGLDLSAQQMPPCVDRWLDNVCPYDWISPTDSILSVLLIVLGEERIIAVNLQLAEQLSKPQK